ncbi:AAA family ATPase [Candidatus Pacearchaeota archaeon]|nr:AAA family ATPase [Candidatus Pacearchaeota archaeon]
MKKSMRHKHNRAGHEVKHHAAHITHASHAGKHLHFAHRDVIGKRVQTWIPQFDHLIQGGFVKDSTNLLVGGSGSGKSIFATQFLVEAMNRGEKGLYVTFEEKKKQFYENMLSLGWDLADYEKKGLFTFLEYTPIKVKTMLEEGGGSIESIIVNKKVSRMVIDSITSFALLFSDELSQREAALALFSMIRDWDCTSLLTLEEDPLDKNKSTSNALEFEVDSIITIYYVREARERQRYLEILKMRGTNHSNKVYPFSIGKKGLVIRNSPVSRVFG